MSTSSSVAIVILCTGEYWQGAEVLVSTLRRYGKLPESIPVYALGMDNCNFAMALPIDRDYSSIPVNQRYFARVADKFQALTLPYQRIVLLDADMLCLGNCSLLWSSSIGNLPFYAVRDVASGIYYSSVVDRIGLNESLLFNAGTMVIHPEEIAKRVNQPFHKHLLELIGQGRIQSYDGGDQGYFNHYLQAMQIEFGFLPLAYNACTDQHWPQLSPELIKLVHFTGGNVNPWDPKINESDRRWPLIARWQQEQQKARS